jgi:Flp pilus assembly pilin Flp
MRTRKRLHINQNRRGLLTFEWVLLFAVLTIGIVGGIAAMRDTVSLKYMQIGGAVGSLNTSYAVNAPSDLTHSGIVVPAMSSTSSNITITPSEYDQ